MDYDPLVDKIIMHNEAYDEEMADHFLSAIDCIDKEIFEKIISVIHPPPLPNSNHF